jgi:hypothetical protein
VIGFGIIDLERSGFLSRMPTKAKAYFYLQTARISETFENIYQTTQSHITENNNLHSSFLDNLRLHKLKAVKTEIFRRHKTRGNEMAAL